MFVAYDKDNNRIYADTYVNEECFCPKCKERVIRKAGMRKKPHFSHLPNSECLYGEDRESKGPWHIHMQELFPREAREVAFFDSDGNLRHIADIYLKESKTVIEFQHSRISVEDFNSRTTFHTSEGRRIIWVFDASKKDSPLGHLKQLYPYRDCWHYVYNWSQPHADMLSVAFGTNGFDQSPFVSICLHLGSEGDIVHRIVIHDNGYKRIVLSIHPFNLMEFDSNEFFDAEFRWTHPSLWAEKKVEKHQIENVDNNTNKRANIIINAGNKIIKRGKRL